MLLLNKHLQLLFLKLTVHITNFSAPFHVNLMTRFTLSFQANQLTCTVSEKCVLVHILEPMLTFTTPSIQTTQCCVSTNNKIIAFTVQGVGKGGGGLSVQRPNSSYLTFFKFLCDHNT